MQIEINGEAREVDQGITVDSLLQFLGMTERPVAVERNREIVPRAAHSTTTLSAGDRLELVQFVGGG